ncbi:MAG: hypothetical protein DIU53_007280 [Thermobifida fusca]|jgi:DNA-directed RNA polymerase subunit RPC12/RpoP|uniref:hypothetical protein n=1 Tax=Thermobifida TaxID=83677 RepID=UPI00156BB7F2|nr:MULTISPECIES: hypothetical protein [Thermobifida]MDD6790725.1 hypothetical protein [Thermobifida fusca]QOS59310.1 hypothetical protein IM867_02405 [Thermobifida fusca]
MSQPPPPMPPASPSPISQPCSGCGAHLEFAPGTLTLVCPYCGFSQQITAPARPVQEYPFEQLVAMPRKRAAELAPHHLVCSRCGAHTLSDALSSHCQFCSAPLVVDTSEDPQIVPEAVVPFTVDRSQAREALRKWTQSRWFAPNGLKKVADAETMKSTYLPHWTFDADTVTAYRGRRGEYYYVTVTDSEGRRRRERRTAWYPASGTVSRRFDDVLVVATDRVPVKRLDALDPWPLAQARPYAAEFLAGHHTVRYSVEPEQGLEIAKGKMRKVIEQDCRRDIGGDEQRLDWVNTQYSNVAGKLVLLPVWSGSYLYNGKSWQVLINGCTGEVQGDRPYSAVKIAFAVLVALIVVAAVIAVIRMNGG